MDNVYVLRIANSTGNSGSFFQSTPINQKFEDEIQNLIKIFQKKMKLIIKTLFYTVTVVEKLEHSYMD